MALVSLTRRYTALLARTGIVAVQSPPADLPVAPGSYCFRLALETGRAGAAVAVLHDGSDRVGYLPPEITRPVLEVFELLGSRARRVWVHGDIDENGVSIRLPSLQQIKQWMR